jgi:hypothetical protein
VLGAHAAAYGLQAGFAQGLSSPRKPAASQLSYGKWLAPPMSIRWRVRAHGGTTSQVYTLAQEADGEGQLRVTTILRVTQADRTLMLRRTYVHAP